MSVTCITYTLQSLIYSSMYSHEFYIISEVRYVSQSLTDEEKSGSICYAIKYPNYFVDFHNTTHTTWNGKNIFN